MRQTPGHDAIANVPLMRSQEPGMVAWRAFLQAHATIMRRLEEELEAHEALSLADFDVLVQLATAPDRRLRMSELAERALLSRSGMTRRVDRLERSGMVGRRDCDVDRRGAFAVLTPAGLRRLRSALPAHLEGIQRHFVARLDATDLPAFARAMDRLSRSDGRSHGAPDECPLADPVGHRA